MVRFYIELDKLAENERVASRAITQARLIAAAQRILHPYVLQVKEVAWWSVYEIAQRLADCFDDVSREDRGKRTPRVFLAGDACHTHSPKAGQGMNVSMQDAFNLGWKLASVVEGRCDPALLDTYAEERKAVATDLIAFDRQFASLLSARSTTDVAVASQGDKDSDFQRYFIRQGRYTAGTETRYAPSLISGENTYQPLAKGFQSGMRFHSARVVRLADSKPMHLGHVHKADGRWRLFVFDRKSEEEYISAPLDELCGWLERDSDSPLRRFGSDGSDIDSFIDLRAVLRRPHRSISISSLPTILMPGKGKYGLIDYEKTFCPDFGEGRNIFEMREIGDEGCVVIVRPDQYVAHVLPIDQPSAIGEWFEHFLMTIQTPV